MIIHVNNEEEFNSIIQKEKVLVDFYAAWCGPCRMLTPILEELAEDPSFGIDIVKVDTDEVANPAIKYRVQAIPTLILFSKGEPINRFTGFMRKEQIIDFVK